MTFFMKKSLFIFERLQIVFFGKINDHELVFWSILISITNFDNVEKARKNW